MGLDAMDDISNNNIGINTMKPATISAKESAPKPALASVSAPAAKKIPKKIEYFGDVRIDDYAWLRPDDWGPSHTISDPDVLAYLNQENQYAESILAGSKQLKEKITDEIMGRIKFDDETVPVRIDDYFYYSRLSTGQNYYVHLRKHKTLDATEEVILDENALAAASKYFDLHDSEPSYDHTLLAYSVDFDGSEEYDIYIKNLKDVTATKEVGASHGSVVWAADNGGFFYDKLDDQHRSNKIYYHRIGDAQAQDVLIFSESNEEFSVSIANSSDLKYLLIKSSNAVSSESYYIDLSDKSLTLKHLLERKKDILYSVDIADGEIYMLINDLGRNFRLITNKLSDHEQQHAPVAQWAEILGHRDDYYIEDFDVSKKYIAYSVSYQGLTDIYIIDKQQYKIVYSIGREKFGDCYSLSGGFEDYKSSIMRMGFSAMNRPNEVIDYDIEANELVTRKVQEIPSGFDPNAYVTKRIWVDGSDKADNVRIPVSILYRKDLDAGVRPSNMLLYGYGSYGISVSPRFSSKVFSLVDRGFIYAIAHIRGGDDLGYNWYEQAKFLTKKRTFNDFIDVADFMARNNYTSPDKLAIMGGSAGGMLMGVALNARPTLFKTVVAHVPFVDVLSTMLDGTLPLTPGEYNEWGNPAASKEYYDYIKSYSPYENVKNARYNNIMVTAGINDPRVTYWEPAKWVAKLRAHNESTDNRIILKTIMDSGHFGATGIRGVSEEWAEMYGFVLECAGVSS